MKLELYSPEALFLCARIYALWNVYYSLATFNCWSFCLSKGMDCVWELKALCIAHTNSSSSSRSSSGTYRKWNAQIVRHGNFHDDTQWHSKNARNYFWLMHSIILFDSLILSFLHSFAFSLLSSLSACHWHCRFVLSGSGLPSPVDSSFVKERRSETRMSENVCRKNKNARNENDKLRECYRRVQQFY